MWRTIGLMEVDALRQWLSVVDGSAPWCGGQSVEDLQVSIQRNRGQVFLYTGANFQIAIRFEFDPTRERWQMASAGFVGNTTPAAALDLIVARLRSSYKTRTLRPFSAWCRSRRPARP